MDWHASVYGARSGAGEYHDFDDDADTLIGSFPRFGASYGRAYGDGDDPDSGRTYGVPSRGPLVDEDELIRRGGAAYDRAHDVLSSGRMHECRRIPSGDGLVCLAAKVASSVRRAADYRVSVDIDAEEGSIEEASCTCPAFGRYSELCKHVVALVLHYDKHPDDFHASPGVPGVPGAAGIAGIPGVTVGLAGHGVVAAPYGHATDRSLALFMRERDAELTLLAKTRQLDLLKEIGRLADSGGAAGTGESSAIMPPGGVTLLPTVECQPRGCTVTLRIQARTAVYVIKDIRALLRAVHARDFVSYGKRLAFMHTREAFDDRAQRLFDVLDRADQIRNDIDPGEMYRYRPRTEAARMQLSDQEIADLFDIYIDAPAMISYAPSPHHYVPTMPTPVVDGNPDLGLAVIEAGAADGFVIMHRQCVERFIVGQRSSYVIVRPLTRAVLRAAADDVGASAAARQWIATSLDAGRGDIDAPRAAIHRCDAALAAGRDILELLCGESEQASMTLAEADVPLFSRTLLPLLAGTAAEGAADGAPGVVTGAASGDATGTVTGDTAGTVTGNATGTVTGDTAGNVSRGLTGDATGTAIGEATGAATAAGTDGLAVPAGAGMPTPTALPPTVSDQTAPTQPVPTPAAPGHAALPPATPSSPASETPLGGALSVALPERLRRLVRVPCRIECYLDRDMDGISCDVQARYGDTRFAVFDGVDARGVTDGTMRDRDAERLAVEAVLHYFPRPTGAVARLPERDDEAIYTLLTEGLAVLRSIGTVYCTPAFDRLTAMSRPTISVGLSVASGLVEISPIADEIDPKDVAALLAGYRKRRRFHRLRDGSFVDLRDMDVSAVDELADDLGLGAGAFEHGPVTVPAFEAYYLDHQVADAGKQASFTAYLNDLRVVDPDQYRVPGALADVLRPYQAEGFRWLSAVCDKGFGGILADEMGLGKTVQLLSFLLARRDEARRVGPNLIVCPASLVYNWAAEAARFAPDLNVAVVAGTKAARRAMLDDVRSVSRANGKSQGDGDTDANDVVVGDAGWQGAGIAAGTDTRADAPDVLITSYDLLRRDIADYAGLDCYAMVLDEAQYIKNAATKSAKAVRQVTARHRFALTGTPIENRLSELWSIFDFLMPGMLGGYTHFRERFEQPVLSGDERAQAKLQAFVGPFILRRLKAQVLKDLPDKIDNVITVRLEGEQRKLYAALEQQLRATLNKTRDVDFSAGRIQVLAQLTRLRQVCCDPRLLYDNVGSGASAAGDAPTPTGSRRAAPSAKLDAIVELVDSCRDAGRKMLIFSQFTSYLDLIAQRLRAGGVDYDMITGATPKRRRLELVERFNADATPVFLISLKAGNTGLNLTGACVVVHADPWWNAAAQNQATDRAHRIGQTQDVNVYQIVAEDTIEERILTLQRTKADLADRFVDEAASSTGRSMAALTKDDILALLG